MAFLDPSSPIEKYTGNLPHWEQGDVWCFVTWRLADSLPQGKLEELEQEKRAWLNWHPQPWSDIVEEEYHERFSRRVDDWLDRGAGSCLLRDRANAAIVSKALLHFDGTRCEVDAFVVMPNHVHALFRARAPHTVPELVRAWKGYTARQINQREGTSGVLWQAEYWDRLIRTSEHFAKCREYIAMNPIRAKLRRGEFALYERRTGIPARYQEGSGEAG
jgi:REP element-mobilizing transposase RayT